jgi:chromosome segregation ATPase
METESPRKEAAKPAEVPKQSAVDLLQLSNLKQEIKQLEVANAKLLKELELEKEKNYSLENKISETGERLQSASRNYFALETELTQAREEASSLRQEMQQKNNISNGRDEELLYYKNEIKVLSAEKLRLSEAATDLASRHQSVLDELQNYRRLFNSGSELRPFHELEEELRSMKEMNKELKLRYQYSVEEKDRIEEDLRNSRTMVEEMEAEKKYIERKYESLTNELNSPSLALSKVSEKSNGDSHLSSSYVFEEMPCLDRKDSNLSAVSSVFGGEVDRHEKELQEVKRQAKELGEENNYLRGLLQKEKKSSSKSQLKL